MYQVYISIDCEIFTQQVPGLLCYEKNPMKRRFEWLQTCLIYVLVLNLQ